MFLKHCVYLGENNMLKGYNDDLHSVSQRLQQETGCKHPVTSQINNLFNGILLVSSANTTKPRNTPVIMFKKCNNT